ncbi:MAG TPA: cysteine--tRNA ligase [Nitrososphaeraceae archaeon]|nr:cysteine--tRNA ligase [Nitrososphaeraceae archaeon]
MRLYNTLTRMIDEINTQHQIIRIYLCGVTVYDDSHIGHARTIIVFDVLRRYLEFKGYTVNFIQNFTDVDDKIINRAKREGLTAKEIAAKYIENYFIDFSHLNVLPANQFPRATEHIKEMINLIQGLINKNYAYITLNGVYFRVRSFSTYGNLSKKTIEELESGSRVEIDQSKENPLDFALWKFYSEEPAWDSPWGRGRPGWHIECSAMALKYFESPFEIHGGGNDLIFPHHENEIAQSEAFCETLFAKLWLHTGMVTINSEKMSKSLGNIITVREALNRWGANSLRIFCISVQYSKPLDFSDKILLECMQRWRQIETCAYELRFANGCGGQIKEIELLTHESIKEFTAALEDDLNTSLALTIFMKFVADINRYAANDNLTHDMSRIAIVTFNHCMEILGLKVLEPTDTEKKEIEDLVVIRNKFRTEKKFEDSDSIRRQLIDRYGVELMDHKNRTLWKKVETPLMV